mgnify:CR=1 FL=1
MVVAAPRMPASPGRLVVSSGGVANVRSLLDPLGDDRRLAIELAYRNILNRKPTADDLRDAEQFLTSDSALADLCLALFNLNEFVYLD